MGLFKKNKTNEPKDFSVMFPVLFGVIMLCVIVGLGTFIYDTVRNHDKRVISDTYAASTKIEIIESGSYTEPYPEISATILVKSDCTSCPYESEPKDLDFYIERLKAILLDCGYESAEITLIDSGTEENYSWAKVEAETVFATFFENAKKQLEGQSNFEIIASDVNRASPAHSKNQAYINSYLNALERAEGLGNAFGNVLSSHIVSVKELSNVFYPEKYTTECQVALEISLELE